MYYYDVLNDYSLSLIGNEPPKDLNDCKSNELDNMTLYYNEYDELVYVCYYDDTLEDNAPL